MGFAYIMSLLSLFIAAEFFENETWLVRMKEARSQNLFPISSGFKMAGIELWTGWAVFVNKKYLVL